MQYTTIQDVWVAFDDGCGGDAPVWDRDEMQAKLKERFPGKRYEEITPEDVGALVEQMWHGVYQSDGSDGYSSGTWGYTLRGANGEMWTDGGWSSCGEASDAAAERLTKTSEA